MQEPGPLPAKGGFVTIAGCRCGNAIPNCSPGGTEYRERRRNAFAAQRSTLLRATKGDTMVRQTLSPPASFAIELDIEERNPCHPPIISPTFANASREGSGCHIICMRYFIRLARRRRLSGLQKEWEGRQSSLRGNNFCTLPYFPGLPLRNVVQECRTSILGDQELLTFSKA